jgi:hypothetical protein
MESVDLLDTKSAADHIKSQILKDVTFVCFAEHVIYPPEMLA